MPPLTPSKSVKAYYAKDKDAYLMQIAGRAPSVLGKHQGDHVTAYRLIEEGLYSSISGLAKEEVEHLQWLKNRESLRQRRGKLYDFISAIGALTDEETTKKLLSEIDELLKKYNEERHKKTQLRKDTKSAQNDHNLTAKRLASVLKEVESRYRFNGELIRDLFIEISRLLLTFYNKIPHSSYFPIEHFQAPDGEGAKVKTALDIIKKQLIECDKIRADSGALTAKLSTRLIPAFLDLIHYPEITDVKIYNKKKKTYEIIGSDDILQKHQIQTQSDGLKTSIFRDNSKKNLINTLARHIHILVSVYPDLEDIFDVNDIINSFTEKFIKREPFGWPTFKAQTEIDDITQKVKDKFQRLQNRTADRHYTNYTEYDDLVSSSDEEEVTTPSPRKAPSSRTKIASAAMASDVLSASERSELEQLRKFKEIIDDNLVLSEEIQEQLRSECPILFQQKKVVKTLFK